MVYSNLIAISVAWCLAMPLALADKPISCKLDSPFPGSERPLPGPKVYRLFKAQKGLDLSNLEEKPIFELKVTGNQGSAELIASKQTHLSGLKLSKAQQLWGPLRHVTVKKQHKCYMLLKEPESNTTFMLIFWFDQNEHLQEFQAIGWSLGCTKRITIAKNYR